jgi:hypothetical protein
MNGGKKCQQVATVDSTADPRVAPFAMPLDISFVITQKLLFKHKVHDELAYPLKVKQFPDVLFFLTLSALYQICELLRIR